MSKEHIESSRLHCLVDGEVDLEERTEIMSVLDEDESQRTQACLLYHQKELIRMAYEDVEPPRSRQRRNWTLGALAASMILAITAGLGFQLMKTDPVQQAGVAPTVLDDASRLVLLDSDGSGQTLADPARDETRIVFQLTNPEVAKATEVLDEIEGVLDLYASEHKPLRVELVAHGDGLGHLRTRLTHHAERIGELSQRFSNLTFVACENTIERISNEQGFHVEVLPQVVVIQSGVNHVAQRQREGWAYIHL
ncbi:MAG: hypothetical protein ACPG4N_00245 [Gammaproteobacteria bacterium]